MSISTLAPFVLQGFVLGWSVAWPPGPINAEMIRRGLASGFWPAFAVGAGASTGDSLWAIAVALGAGSLVGVPAVRVALGLVSLGLLVLLAALFLGAAWRAWRRRGDAPGPALAGAHSARTGYLLGLTLALTSPWNAAFWLAVIGRQATLSLDTAGTFAFAGAVIAGALTWCVTLGLAVRLGARFATPAWHVATSAATGGLMVYFAVRLAIALLGA